MTGGWAVVGLAVVGFNSQSVSWLVRLELRRLIEIIRGAVVCIGVGSSWQLSQEGNESPPNDNDRYDNHKWQYYPRECRLIPCSITYRSNK